MRLSDERFTLLGMLVVGYASFLIWFCGWPLPAGIPLSESDAETYRKLFEETAIKDEFMSTDFEEFLQKDDGNTIGLTMKLKFRNDLSYPSNVPEGFAPAETVDEALSSMMYSTVSTMIPYGATPVAVFNHHGQLVRSVSQTAMDEDEEDELVGISTGGEGGWDQTWVLRFRSRRDLCDVLLAINASPLYTHRQGAIEKIEADVVSTASVYFFSIDLICSLMVMLGCILIFLASEACFPGPPKLKEEKKVKKKVSKKDSKDGSKDKKSSSKDSKVSDKESKDPSSKKDK